MAAYRTVREEHANCILEAIRAAMVASTSWRITMDAETRDGEKDGWQVSEPTGNQTITIELRGVSK